MLQGFGLQGLGLGLIYLVEGSRSQGEARRSIPVLIILYPHSGLASNLSSILRSQPLTSYRIINKMNRYRLPSVLLSLEFTVHFGFRDPSRVLISIRPRYLLSLLALKPDTLNPYQTPCRPFFPFRLPLPVAEQAANGKDPRNQDCVMLFVRACFEC